MMAMLELGPEQWGEVKRLFGAALELPAVERAGLIDRIEDETVRKEVRSLLEHLEAGETMGEAPYHGADEQRIGTRVGPYRIESILGHGGMGAVYRAARDDGEFHQVVAIKLVRAAAESPETMQRFRQERQILARLSHPNIARLLDGGSTDQGVPYLVMEFIAGEPITVWCRQRELDIDHRLRLWNDVCSAVDYANKHAVVHRDLKPGNILVTDEGVPKLLDFGIAKMVGDEGPGAGGTVGLRLMTPEYAAPEQVLGEPVTAAVDVYALGLCLYELLTGKKAQDVADLSPATVERVVCREEPPSPAQLNPQLAGDLDNIVRMAIRKEPGRRYASVGDLGGDIRRYLDGRPVSARPDTVSYRTSKFLKRNRTSAVAVAAAILVAGMGVAYRLATPARPRVLRVNQLTQSGHVLPSRIAADDRYVYFVEGTPGREVVERLPVEGGVKEDLYGPYKEVNVADVSRDGSRLLLEINDISGKPLNPLWEGAARRGGALRRVGNFESRCAAFSPVPPSRIAVCGLQSVFEVNRDGGGLCKVRDTAGVPNSLRWSPPSVGSVLRFALWNDENHKASLWEAESGGGNPHPLFEHWLQSSKAGSIDEGVWGNGGRYYFFRSYGSGGFNIWATREGSAWLGRKESTPTLIHSTPARIDQLAASPEGKYAFFVSYQVRTELARYDARYDDGRGEFRPFLAGVPARYISFSADGRWIAYTSTPGDILWRSRPDGSEATRLTPPGMRAYTPNWSPDGSMIAFGAFVPGRGPAAYTIPLGGGMPQRIGDEHARFTQPRFSPDGTKVLLLDTLRSKRGGSNYKLTILDWKTRATTSLTNLSGAEGAVWLADGRHVVVFGGREARRIDIVTGEQSVLVAQCGSHLGYRSSRGDFIYYQAVDQPRQPIFRVASSGGRPEQVASAGSIPQSDPTLYEFVGLDPTDAPMVSIQRSNSDLYSLELDLP
jgi:serine/threonine protein kinase/dipeptidyl aminopeptidase/acylaminoacyl peptidase